MYWNIIASPKQSLTVKKVWQFQNRMPVSKITLVYELAKNPIFQTRTMTEFARFEIIYYPGQCLTLSREVLKISVFCWQRCGEV